ncbi:MAG TPA: hydrogenase [Casimicrobiaceae bacterium]|nr:hydrogenase [Casimicrobiaceae bacterium]
MDIATAPAASAHPLLAQLAARHAFAELDAATFDTWIAAPGHALLLFVEEPAKLKETLDLAVIAPELVRAFPGTFRPAVLMPQAARAIAVRYGFRRWPALVVLRDGQYVGAIDGLRNWDEYVGELVRLVAAPVVRPPSIGIAVAGPGTPGPACH